MLFRSVYDWTADLVEVETLEPMELPGGSEALELYRVAGEKEPEA